MQHLPERRGVSGKAVQRLAGRSFRTGEILVREPGDHGEQAEFQPARCLITRGSVAISVQTCATFAGQDLLRYLVRA
jgi:hypothetical protein